MKPAALFACAVLVVTSAATVGCVQRKLVITSNPSGALVTLNDQELGRTPLTTDLRWYGDQDLVVRRDGYQTLMTHKNVHAPWWQWVPFDFFAELMPWHPTDTHTINVTLTQSPPDVTPSDLIRRGLDMKQHLPTTRPGQ